MLRACWNKLHWKRLRYSSQCIVHGNALQAGRDWPLEFLTWQGQRQALTGDYFIQRLYFHPIDVWFQSSRLSGKF